MKENIILQEDTMDRILIIQKIVERKITQAEGSQELGVTDRQVRRLVCRFKQEGWSGLVPRSRGGNNRLSVSIRDQALSFICKHYPDFGPTFACEKLKETHGLSVSRETLRKWMISAGLWKGKKRRKARIHQSRERRSRFGELVQIDGSYHDWFEGRGPKCCLIVMIDDATSRLIHMRFEECETTFGYMRAVETHLKRYGRPVSYYSDKHSIFRKNREDCVDRLQEPTHFHRALKDLKIELICAHTAQAKGRVERANKTLQDRLIKEMRLLGISSMEEGNAYLSEFIDKYNQKFSVSAADASDAHRPVHHTDKALMLLLSKQTIRKVSKNLEISYNKKIYQLTGVGKGYRLRQGEVMIHETCYGETHLVYQGEFLQYKIFCRSDLPLCADSKELISVVNRVMERIDFSGFCPQGPQPPQPPPHVFINDTKGCGLVGKQEQGGHF
jgi:transposase